MNLEPIRALIKLAGDLENQLCEGDGAYPQDYHDVHSSAVRALPALSQLLEAVTNLTAYEAELRSKPEVPFPGCAEWQRNPDLMTQHFVWLAYKNCADKLQRLLHPEDTK